MEKGKQGQHNKTVKPLFCGQITPLPSGIDIKIGKKTISVAMKNNKFEMSTKSNS